MANPYKEAKARRVPGGVAPGEPIPELDAVEVEKELVKKEEPVAAEAENKSLSEMLKDRYSEFMRYDRFGKENQTAQFTLMLPPSLKAVMEEEKKAGRIRSASNLIIFLLEEYYEEHYKDKK